jgi:imidazolonepropionase-like amidohydrolase
MIVGSLLGLAEAVVEEKKILSPSDRSLMPATRRAINATGRIVMPGFIDSGGITAPTFQSTI